MENEMEINSYSTSNRSEQKRTSLIVELPLSPLHGRAILPDPCQANPHILQASIPLALKVIATNSALTSPTPAEASQFGAASAAMCA